MGHKQWKDALSDEFILNVRKKDATKIAAMGYDKTDCRADLAENRKFSLSRQCICSQEFRAANPQFSGELLVSDHKQ